SCLAIGSVALWLLGYPDQAIQRSQAAVVLGLDLGQPSALAMALHFEAVLRQYRREGEQVRTTAEAAAANATGGRLSVWLAGSLVLRGWAMVEQGAGASGIAVLREGLNDWAATGSGSNQTYLRGLLAEALAREGQLDEALPVVAEALALIEKRG